MTSIEPSLATAPMPDAQDAPASPPPPPTDDIAAAPATTVAQTTVAPTTVAPTTVAQTTVAPTTVAAPPDAPADAPSRAAVRPMLGQLQGVRRALGQLFQLALAIELLGLAMPFCLQWAVDHALPSGDWALLRTLALGCAVLVVVRVSVRALRGAMRVRLRTSVLAQGRANLFTHLGNLPAGWFGARPVSDVLRHMASHEQILQAVTSERVEMVLDGGLALLTLVAMAVYAPALAAMVVLGAAAYGVTCLASMDTLRRGAAEALVQEAARDATLLDTLRGMSTVKLLNAQEARRSQWLAPLVDALDRRGAVEQRRMLLRVAHGLVAGGVTILVAWLGATRVLHHVMSLGMLLAFLLWQHQFLRRVRALADAAMDLSLLQLHADRLAAMVHTAPETQSPPGLRTAITHRPAAIEVRNLRFRYSESGPWVLDGVSFRVAAGESVAITGVSGAGKTTLLKLLASLLQPTEGEILVDGQPLARAEVRQYRERIGVVLQDDQLFAGSIADNISAFAPDRDQARVTACATLAALHDEVTVLPLGYDTPCGDDGAALSGGQRQRVLLARALYREPGVLLLDEATSQLDLGREAEVAAALGGVAATRVVISNRPQVVEAAGRVVALAQGRVVSGETADESDAVLAPTLDPVATGAPAPGWLARWRAANAPHRADSDVRPRTRAVLGIRA